MDDTDGVHGDDEGTQFRGDDDLGEGGSEVEEEDVYSQLAQKEQDLLLAAQLGKVLLEKNEELEQRNATLLEEFTQKTEELEQERYSLQMQLAQRQDEFESTIKDLQDDVKSLQDQLSSHDNEVTVGNRKHTQDLRQLQQHNETLSEQLRQSVAQQDVLSSELEQLRCQLSSRRTSFDRRVDQVGELEDELESLRHRLQELEVRIRTVAEERDALAAELEDLQEYVLLLEKQRQKQDTQLNDQQREMRELQEVNTSLQVQLDHVTTYTHNSSGSSQTLFSELANMSDMPDGQVQMHNLDRVTSLSAEMLDEDQFECDDDNEAIFSDTAMVSSPFPTDRSSDFPAMSDEHGDISNTSNQQVLDMMGEAGAEWGEEVTNKIHSDRDHPNHSHQGKAVLSSSHDNQNPRERRPVSLTEELQALLMEMTQSSDSNHDNSESHSSGHNDEGAGDDGFGSLDHERLQRQFSLPTIQPDISDILEDQQSRLRELQKERDALQDALFGRLSPNTLLQQTRAERDAALQRVEQLERDLAQSRQDVASLSTQLMAAIRQKVTISQELDQWQVDLSDMLMVQMHSRITEQQRAEQAIGQLEKQVKTKRPSPSPSPFKLHKS